jgi:hypothetical protein
MPSGQVLVELLSHVVISSTNVGYGDGYGDGTGVDGAGVIAGMLTVGAGEVKIVGSPVSSGGKVTGEAVGAL